MSETDQRDGDSVPAGYEPATLYSDSFMGLICGTCGANVARRSADQHSAWHQKLWERIGTS